MNKVKQHITNAKRFRQENYKPLIEYINWSEITKDYDLKTGHLCYIDYSQKYEIQDFNASCLKFNIHKVIEGQGYHQWHWETLPDSKMGERVLTWMTFLKVPEEGGETEFLYQKRRIKPEVGTTLVWPSYFTHLHKGNMVIKGEKYYITGWFER